MRYKRFSTLLKALTALLAGIMATSIIAGCDVGETTSYPSFTRDGRIVTQTQGKVGSINVLDVLMVSCNSPFTDKESQVLAIQVHVVAQGEAVVLPSWDWQAEPLNEASNIDATQCAPVDPRTGNYFPRLDPGIAKDTSQTAYIFVPGPSEGELKLTINGDSMVWKYKAGSNVA